MNDDRDLCDQRLPEQDPLAIFHQLPAPRVGDSEVASMKAAVAELRRARELARRSEQLVSEAEIAAPLPATRRAQLKNTPWRSVAAAAALLVVAVLFGGPGRVSVLQDQSTLAAAPANVPDSAANHLPLVEDLDPLQAELIQIEDDGMSLVVVLAAGPF